MKYTTAANTLAILASFNNVHSFVAPTKSNNGNTIFLSPSQSKKGDCQSSICMSTIVNEETNVNEVTKTPTYLDDGFVFGLQESGINRPKGKESLIVVDGDSLETTPMQVAVVSATLASHLGFIGFDIAQILHNSGDNYLLTSMLASITIATSWVMADLGSGILHWSVDNYGNGRTPIMGNIIAAFQGHHAAPWTITKRGFCNNIYKLCVPFGIPTVALITVLAHNPFVSLFTAVFCGMEILSQEFHKWSHMTKGQVSPQINWLQEAGITIGRKPHALHHMAPYEGNYCIISGVCNDFLDQSGFFRWLEHMIYNWNGVESNAWKLDAELKAKTLRGEYRTDI